MAKKKIRKPDAPARPRRGAPVKHKTNPLVSEVKYLCLAALGILLLLSVYIEGAAGFIGRFIEQLTVGLLGFGAYILPFAVIAAAVYALFSRSRRISSALLVKTAVFFWCLIAFIHIVAIKELDAYPGVFAYFSAMYALGSVSNGGLMGALLGNFLRGMIGAGAYIVLLVLMLVLLVLWSGRSFVHVVSFVGQGARLLADGMSRVINELFTPADVEYEEVSEPPRGKVVDVHAGKRSSSAIQMPPRRQGDLKPLPPKSEKKPAPKTRPELPVIEDRSDRDAHRVLLVNEEINYSTRTGKPSHPLFKARTDNPLSAPAVAERIPETEPEAAEIIDLPGYMGEQRAQHATSPGRMGERPARMSESDADRKRTAGLDITVKGLVDEAVFAEADPDPGIPEDIDDYRIDAGLDEPLFEDEPEEEVNHSAKTSGATIVPFQYVESKPAHVKPVKKTEPRTAAPDIPAGVLPRYEDYQFPPISLLTKNQSVNTTGSRTQILENSRILEETLKSFRVEAKVVEVSVGPTVTRYDMSPGPGVKVSAIANLSNDLALSLAAQGIRIEAPIPGKAAVGIEIPNKEPQPVLLREIVEDDAFIKFPSRLAFAVGKDIAGSPVVTDVARMPHLLIAGATGSGKSVCINTLITSLLYKSRPDEVKLLMIDPKVVELSVYNGIPHLLIPVVTDPKKASGALQWAVAEMDNRYNLFAEAGVRDLKSFNEYKTTMDEDNALLPQIVIIIDELADLMMVCKGEVEESICRLAQKARAAGLHLIIATQRPSVDVITGLIKANVPSRLAFAVSSGIDSRTVLDMYGAEKLLGKGDMLFLPMGKNKPIRLQGGYISDKEIENVVDFLKKQTVTEYPAEMIEQVTSPTRSAGADEDMDEFFYEAVEFLIEKGKASTSMLQRQFRIGYNRASRLMEDLESRGIVGPEDGVKPRKIMITREEFYNNYG